MDTRYLGSWSWQLPIDTCNDIISAAGRHCHCQCSGNWQLATWQAVSAIGKPHDTDTEQHREPRALEVEEQTYAVIALPASTLT